MKNTEDKNSKQVWKNIKNWENKEEDIKPNLLIYKNESIEDPQKIADTFNNASRDDVNDMIDKIENTDFDPIKHFKENINLKQRKIKFQRINMHDMRIFLKEIKNTKSDTKESIGVKTIKNLQQILETPLLLLTNRIIETKIYPECLKVSKAIPIFKKKKISSDVTAAHKHHPSHW